MVVKYYFKNIAVFKIQFFMGCLAIFQHERMKFSNYERVNNLDNFSPFKCKHHNMVKHTQKNCWLLPTNCLSVFDHFVRLALKGLIMGPNMMKTR